MGYIIGDNYAIRFRPLRSNHGMEFDGWPAKGSTAAPSHPSEGWYEKGQRVASTRTHGASWAFSNHVQVQAGLQFGSFFFPKKGSEPSGTVEQPRELPEPTTRKF
jgi:hypothetical protein